jgi:hypothetical protein
MKPLKENPTIYCIVYVQKNMEYKNEYYTADDCLSLSSGSQIKNQLDKIKRSDRGYNKIWRNVVKNNKVKRTKIEVYTTSGVGNHIRDAETGDYYPYLVGTADEDLFFSVILATGECRSNNGSSTLFYLNPEKYMKHQHTHLDDSIVLRWNERRQNRMLEKKMVVDKKQSMSSVVVK